MYGLDADADVARGGEAAQRSLCSEGVAAQKTIESELWKRGKQNKWLGSFSLNARAHKCK